MEIDKGIERRSGESLKACVARKISINIKEGKPRDQAVAISFSQCSLRKDLPAETVIEILKELERDEFLYPILEGVTDAFEKAVHGVRRKKKKKKKAYMVYKQAEGSQGEHGHPHDPNGKHSHSDLPGDTGSHDHESAFGRHKHRDGDSLEGGHPNAGSGRHRHLISAGLTSMLDKIITAHYPIHKWIPDFKQAWVKHVGESWRTTTRRDWMQHAMFSLHSAGCSVEDHIFTFVDEKTRLLKEKYELNDGTILVPGKEEYERECEWFKSQLPDVEKFLNLDVFKEEYKDEEDKD